MKETYDIVKNILPEKSAYDRVLYLLYNYRDLKKGVKINEESRNIMHMIDKAVELIEEDRYICIIKMMLDGMTVDQMAESIPLERKSIYKHRKRLIKRLSIVIFGDAAL